MLCHVPARLVPRAAIVVAMHGCTQSAAAYDHGSGWSALAEREGFLLVLPEQRQVNNANLCFNWFRPEHTGRDSGEAFSIRQMVAAATERYSTDPARVFVVGLSAGGAMANAMMATYPDVFAGGAVIAGLPYRAAETVSDALSVMAKGRLQPPRLWGGLVRDAHNHAGAWPRLSIWHGDLDPIVHPLNADATLRQWINVHGLSPSASITEQFAGHSRLAWHGEDGKPMVEAWTVAGLTHAVPLGARDGERFGAVGPFQAEVGLASTPRIAAFWEIAPKLPPPPQTVASVSAAATKTADPAQVITDALRKAGLVSPVLKPSVIGHEAAELLRRLGLLKK
jgi:poly(hydroxyalkanoate) depolymerase family esterase